MTLLDLCEPLLEKICLLNRQVRAGRSPEYSQLRVEIDSAFKELRARASGEGGIQEQYQKIEMPLIFFVDSLIAEMPIPAAEQWHKNRMGYERNELAGDEKFFDLLDQDLADRTAAAKERLAVYYTCMGLGFAGFYANNPEYIRKKMLDCAARMGDVMDADQMARICPDAYQHVNTSNLIEPPGSKLLGIFLGLLGLIVVLAVANLYLFRYTTAELGRTVDAVISQEAAARAQDGAGSEPVSRPTASPDNAAGGR